MEYVILVDENDNQIGTEEKLKTHEKGLLHRAFSVYVFNSKGELILQQRAKTKYHSPLLWTNTACSHPRQGETPEEAAHRRLQEEMGFDCPLTKVCEFIYNVDVGGALREHEYLHVFTGTFNDIPKPNLEEAEDYKYMTLKKVEEDIEKHPEKYTEWFKHTLQKYRNHLQ